jgi:hypothetical protein
VWQQPPTRDIVVLPDGTASIVPAALDQALQAIESEAAQLRRGDCMTVIPIVSDSTATPADQIVRMCVPTERQPYDQDLQDFRNSFHQTLAEERRQLAANRAAKTDILGSLKLAEQEFALDGPKVQKTLVVYSDFIEEDDTWNFLKAPELATPEKAERLANCLATASVNPHEQPDWSNIRVFLGGLQSTETPNMSPQRKEAINRFWTAYFTALHARPFFAVDGPGMSLRFLAQKE